MYWSRKDKRVRLYLVPAILWISHILLFYVVFLLDTAKIIDLHAYDRYIFTDWSAYLRFHGVFTVYYFVVIESNIFNDIKKGVTKLWMKKY